MGFIFIKPQLHSAKNLVIIYLDIELYQARKNEVPDFFIPKKV